MISLNNKQVSQLQSLPGNRKCVDCFGPNPGFADIKQFTLSCISCAGIKRMCIGTHICHLRHVSMDRWKEEHFNAMIEQGGNEVVNRILEATLEDRNTECKDMKQFIRKKYEQMRWKECKKRSEVFVMVRVGNLCEFLGNYLNSNILKECIEIDSEISVDHVKVSNGKCCFTINLRDYIISEMIDEESIEFPSRIEDPFQIVIDSTKITLQKNGMGIINRSGSTSNFNLEIPNILHITLTENGFFIIDTLFNIYKYYLLNSFNDNSHDLGLNDLEKFERDTTPRGLTFFKTFISQVYPNLYKFIENDNLLTSNEIQTLNILFNMKSNSDNSTIDAFTMACIINNSSPDLDFLMDKLEYLTFKDENGISTIIEKVKNYIFANNDSNVSFLKLYLFKCLQFVSNFSNFNSNRNYLQDFYNLKLKNVKNFEFLFNCQSSCDIIIKIESETFHLHRTILASKSSVFKILLDENSKFNDVKNDILEIDIEIFNNSLIENIPNLIIDSFTILFKYLYNFQIDFREVEFSKLQTLLEMSRYYQILQLEQEIDKQLNDFNF